MANQNLEITGFGGGIATNSRSGLPNSCRFSRNLDIYSDDDSVRLNPGLVKASGSIVTDLIMGGTDANPYSTDRYFYGDAGNIYKETSSSVWSLERTVSGGAGQGIDIFSGWLYYATSTTLGRLGISPAVAYDDNFIHSNNLDLDQENASTGQVYTLLSGLSEAAVDKEGFVPTTDPLTTIEVFVNAKGTGDWTLTIHDPLNNNLGSATITNGSIPASGSLKFTFTTPIRVTIGRNFHFHLTSTTGNGSVVSGTSSDFSNAEFNSYFGVLIADTQYHPMSIFTNGQTGTLVIGNEHYLAQWDGQIYNPNIVTLEPGFKVRAITRDNEFLVALAWRGTNNDSYEEGRAYYWDGISPYYNYYYPIMGGSPNAAINFKNRVFSILGSNGDMNLDTDPFHQIQNAPQLVIGKKVEVLPAAITVWQRRIHFGMWSSDDSVGFEAGVYEYGNQSDRSISYTSVSTEVLNNGYQLSTGTTKSTSVKIGFVQAWGKDLYTSWKDGSNYGMDKTSKTSAPATTGSWESLILDQGMVAGQLADMPQHTKYAEKLVITFQALPSGATVVPKYKINRAASFRNTSLGGQAAIGGTVLGDTRAELLIASKYREIEIGFDLTAGSTTPVVTGVYFQWDPLEKEYQES